MGCQFHRANTLDQQFPGFTLGTRKGQEWCIDFGNLIAPLKYYEELMVAFTGLAHVQDQGPPLSFARFQSGSRCLGQFVTRRQWYFELSRVALDDSDIT